MEMTLGFAGTLEPMTNGHMWVIQEAVDIVGPQGKVIVFLAQNPSKPESNSEARHRLVSAVLQNAGLMNVHVEVVRNEYVATAARRLGVHRMIRGQRSSAEFDYEKQLQEANTEILHGVNTLFVIPPTNLASISSSYVRSFMAGSPVGWHVHVKNLVPKIVYDRIVYDWLETQWNNLFTNSDGTMFRTLVGEGHYGGPNRFYHNLDHLVHGLCEIEAWAANTRAPMDDIRVLKKAFWFHDAIYKNHQLHSVSDEEQSAQFFLAAHDSRVDGTKVASLIRATNHLVGNTYDHWLKAPLLGADLAILGQPPTVYREYAANIRKEYQEFSQLDYAAGRIQVLQALMSHELFLDPYFRERYAEQSKINMVWEIKKHEDDIKTYR